VTHRGNRRGDVFLTAQDRRAYLRSLRRYATRYELEVWAYCLMTNHVHLIVVGWRPDSLSRAIGCAHARHAMRLNRANAWTGHLWGNRFYSSVLDDAYLWHAVRYVETNPVRAGMVPMASAYQWSSARAHSGGGRDPLLAPCRPFPGRVDDWSSWLASEEDAEAFQSLRSNTAKGRPSGNEVFVECLEADLRRQLRRPRMGRPPIASR
jgi:putative transposase